MGLKKYEIITVGSDKRVRALRSWQVGDRYVNIGDVGGIVYDEKTLSQDGLCWLFRGNFGFPGARIGGDSIVDVGEATLSATGAPNVDILGSSVVVGSNLRFSSDQTAADAVTLTAADFEQGAFSTHANGQVSWTVNSANYIRTKKPIFMGGSAVKLNLAVPGYRVLALVLDRDGFIIKGTGTSETASGVGVTMTVPAGQYFLLRVTKDPVGAIVPADATAAQIKFTGVFDTKLVVADSRLEINPVTSTGTVSIRSGGLYSIAPGAAYPDSVIRNSRVVINGHATADRMVRLISDFIACNVTLDATTEDAQGVGIYSNVNNLTFTGIITASWNVAARSIIRATDCDNLAVSPTNFPGLAAIQTANVPIKFYGCNLNNARIYHHAQIANTYRDINFDLATKDLGKTFSADRTLGSSEVNGMYRAVLNGVIGPLIESYESVKNMVATQNQKMYNTTIYSGAYFNGSFDIQGTNVFGNTMKHDTQGVSGCKIVNTKATAAKIAGNVRVEDNATLIDVSVTGTGYFGGNSIIQAPSALVGQLPVEGAAYMSDNAVFAPTVVSAGAGLVSLEMKDNAVFAGQLTGASPNYNIRMSDNARFLGTQGSLREFIMEDNSYVAEGGVVAPTCRGLLIMGDDARIELGDLTAIGCITLRGKYKQTAAKTWTGKRVIDSQDAPEYDNNVKTKYDF